MKKLPETRNSRKFWHPSAPTIRYTGNGTIWPIWTGTSRRLRCRILNLQDIELPVTRLSRAIDGVIRVVGRGASWLWLILMVVIVMNVGLRYLFGEGRVEFEEIQWHLNALAFLVAIVYAHSVDVHIRIDVLANRFAPRTQVWVELYGTLLLLLPFVVMVFVFSLPFVAHSWALNETSQSPWRATVSLADKGCTARYICHVDAVYAWPG